MTIFAKLSEKPWLALPGGMPAAAAFAPVKLALRFFLGVVSVIFFLLIVAYGGRMALSGAAPPPEIRQLWPNTLALVLASAAIHWAMVQGHRGKFDKARQSLAMAGILAVCFVLGQLVAWWQLSSSSFFEMAAPAIGFFYLITGLHGLHIIGGLVAVGRTLGRDWDRTRPASLVLSLEVCTTYFHFMLAVWLVLFVLVFTGDNMDLLLTLCGLK